MPQLDPSSYSSQIFWLVLAFVLLYVLLHFITVPMIQKILQRRQDIMVNNLKNAENFKKEAELIEEQYNLSIKEAHARSASIIQEANNKINREMSLRLQELDQVIKEHTRTAEERSKFLKQELSKNFIIQAESLSTILVEKIIGSKPDAKEIRYIINEVK